MKRVLLVVLIVSVLIFVVAFPVLAQDAGDGVISNDFSWTDVMSPDQAGELLLGSIVAVVSVVASAPITTFLTGLIKRVPGLEKVPANSIQVAVAAVLIALYWVSQKLGVAVQFESFTELILIVGPAVLGFYATLRGSSSIYEDAVSRQLPLLGFQRTPPANG